MFDFGQASSLLSSLFSFLPLPAEFRATIPNPLFSSVWGGRGERQEEKRRTMTSFGQNQLWRGFGRNWRFAEKSLGKRDSPLSMPEEAPGPAAQINIPTTACQKSYAAGYGPMHIPPPRITKHPTLILRRAEISLYVAHLPGLCTYTHASELRSTLLERVGCPVTQKAPRDARMWLEGV